MRSTAVFIGAFAGHCRLSRFICLNRSPFVEQNQQSLCFLKSLVQSRRELKRKSRVSQEHISSPWTINHCVVKALIGGEVHNVAHSRVHEATSRSTTMPVLEVQRYFFGVRWSDHEDDDPNGVLLSDNPAALNYADHLIRELKEGGRYNDPNLMVIVRDRMKQVVLSIPFFAACA
jgi:hypothetical protein